MNKVLQQKRQDKGFTQVQMADLCNIAERTYQSIEANKSKPNVKTVLKIAELLGSTVEELFKD